MSAVCVRAVLLCMLLVQVSVRVLTTGSAAERPVLSPRQYQHVDADSGTQLVCDKCPAGTFVSVHCSLLAVRECSPCPNDTFTHGENGVEQCHRCRPPCPEGLVEKLPCTTTQDRTCVCPSNSFLSRDGGRKCQPHLLCPPGTRMKKRGSETEDVVCKPCSKGTFSAVESHSMKCQAHTNCQAQGLLLLSPGTRDRDNVCGPPSLSSVSTTTPLVPTQGVHTPDPLISSHLLSSLIGPAPQGTYSQSVSIQLSGNPDGEDLPGEVLLLNSLDMLTTPRPTQKQLPENQQGQQGSDLLPDPRKRTMDHLEDAETVKTSNNKLAGQDSVSSYYRPTRRGSPRPSTHNNFDINEHLPWMIVLLLLLVLVVIVVCSVKRSSRVLKKGPMQDPSSIMEKAIQKKPSAPPAQVKEKWIYYSNGQGVDILKLVAAQVGTQWIDVYQSLANVTEREVAAFSNGYSSDHERAYAALQHWTIRDSDANLAKLINALHRQRRIDVVEKIRCVMEDNPQLDISQLMMTSVNGSQSLSPIHRPMESPGGGGGGGSGGGGGNPSAPAPGSGGRASSIFGAAKPVDTAAKEREVEERLKKQEERLQKQMEEDKGWGSDRKMRDRDPGWREETHTQRSRTGSESSQQGSTSRGSRCRDGERSGENEVFSGRESDPSSPGASPTPPSSGSSKEPLKVMPAPPPKENAWAKRSAASTGSYDGEGRPPLSPVSPSSSTPPKSSSVSGDERGAGKEVQLSQ